MVYGELRALRARQQELRVNLLDAFRRSVLIEALTALGRRKRPAKLARALADLEAAPDSYRREVAARAALDAVVGREPWAQQLAVARHVEAYRRRDEALSADVRWLDLALDRLADLEPVRAGSARVVLRRVYVQSYATQGLGAERYARASADLSRDERDGVLRAEEREAGVRVVVEREAGVGRGAESYVVAALGVEDEVAADVIRRRQSDDSLAAWVAACWRRGANPRVFAPMLPHGYEERHGIGFDGSIKRNGGAS